MSFAFHGPPSVAWLASIADFARAEGTMRHMLLLRFLFGHGWWIAWHLGFWLILLLSVGLTLLIFG